MVLVVGDERMSMEHWWNDTNRGKTEVLGVECVPRHFVHHRLPTE